MIIKNAAELNELRETAKKKFAVKENGGIKIVVGMATCGIAAGASPVLRALKDEVAALKLDNVTISQVGCIGLCEYEPIVEVIEAGKEKVTYVNMDAAKAKAVIESHIINGKIVNDYIIGASMAVLK